MRLGDLTERLAFQRNTTTANTQGGRTASWATFATIWGRLEPLSASEVIQAASVGSRVVYRGTVATQQLEGASVSVSSITRSGSTATVTTAAAHSLLTGEYVRVAGATQTEYNGKFQATVTSSTVFTYTVTGTPATPATGTIAMRLLLPLSPKNLRIAWTPSWDAAQAAKTLEIHGVRFLGRDWAELDVGEVA